MAIKNEMRFYNEYNSILEYPQGQLKIINNFNNGIIYFQDKIILINNLTDLNRCFHNNLVNFDYKDQDLISVETLNEDLLTYNLEEELIEAYDDPIKLSSTLEERLSSIKKNIVYGKICNCLSDNTIIYLTGVLQIKSNHSYGRSKKGVPIYLFIPNNSIYPPFYVNSNYKKKNSDSNNIYVYIKFKEWNINSKYPIGTCEHIIGEIGNLESEYNNLLFQNNLNYKSTKNNQLIGLDNNNLLQNDKSSNRKDELDQNLFSIDPIGCKDIDDVIGITKNNNNYIISIHISDVSNFINVNDDIDQQARLRGTSIYSSIKQINMLPEELSCDICSLLPNKLRFTICLKIVTDLSFNILETKFYHCSIKSKFALDYDTATNLICNQQYDNQKYPLWLHDNLNLLIKFVKKNNIMNTNIFDSHSIIDNLMVFTNSEVAKKIYDYDNKSCLLRLHLPNELMDINLQNSNLDFQLVKFLNIFNQNSAKYILSNNYNISQISHYGLMIKFYTHFTSPIRRYFDIMVHRQLKKIILNDYSNQDVLYNLDYLDNICNQLNDINDRVKKFERDSIKIKNLFDPNINKLNLESYIINFNKFYNLIQIYIPDLNFTHTFRPLSKKLNSILNFNFNENEMIINNVQTNKILKFTKYQKIKINLIPDLSKEFKFKCNIKIIDPNINEII